ncbi:MAG TPA: response regulator transcription factor [Syntrophorhabdales bacterium]|nr:response regulator transcription factor [Syntrophorhabdales bacterium]
MTDNRLPITELKPTIFIVDDDASMRTALSYLLQSAGYEVEAFASAEEFLGREHYDGVGCIILDVRMPGLSGMELQEKLTGSDYRMPIIFLTGHGELPMGVQAMKRGATDFLTKPCDDEQLLGAVHRAIEKDKQARGSYQEKQEIRSRMERLTPREKEILRYVIAGMLNKQIAAQLGIAEPTVKIHRGRIMEKLCAESVADLVRLAEKAGIASPEQ